MDHKKKKYYHTDKKQSEQNSTKTVKHNEPSKTKHNEPKQQPVKQEKQQDQSKHKTKTHETTSKYSSKNKPAQNTNNNNKKSKYRSHSPVPKWDFDINFKGKELKETKADLMEILATTDPDEILITPLVQKSKQVKFPKPKQNTSSEASPTEELSAPTTVDLGEGESANITIDISQTCPICDRTIREIMYALHDYEHDRLAHFDCVFKKVKESISDKLTNNRTLVYLGSGSFGIMEKGSNDKLTLIEKIYPGAPVEELLHSDEVDSDDEI